MAKKKEEAAVDPTARVLLVKTVDGELRVTIPKDSKITFGPAIPYVKNDGREYGRATEYALRIYQGTKENLLAVFAGVREFRELGMPVSKLIVREAGKSVWKSDEDGYSVQADVKKSRAFVAELDLLAAPVVAAPDAKDEVFYPAAAPQK